MLSRYLPAATLAASAICLSAQTTTPSFELSRDTYPAVSAYNVVQGDFNNDGKPDVVVGGGASEGILTLRLGNGDGTFQAPRTAGQSDYSYINDMATGDFNNDGNLDIAIASTEGLPAGGEEGDVQVFFGNGDGTFQAPVVFTPKQIPNFFTFGDFNGDGLLDIAVGDINDQIEIWNNTGARTFTFAKAFTVGSNGPQKVRAGKFDGDGITHLAVYAAPSIYVVWNDGHENFTPVLLKTYAGNATIDLNIGDANQDGRDDVLVAYSAFSYPSTGQTFTASFDVFYGQGNQKFFTRNVVSQSTTQAPYLTPASPWAVDVNGDGIADIAAEMLPSSGQNLPSGLYVWLGHPDGSYDQTPEAYVPTTHGNGALIPGDFNRDGMMDFAQTLPADNETEIYINGAVHAPCATSAISPTVTVCQPINDTYLPSPMNVQANAYDKNTMTAMQEYVDGKEVYSQDVTNFSILLSENPGTHLFVTKAWDATGLNFQSNRTVTVYSGTPGPACPAALDAAAICVPSQLSSHTPVQILGNGWTKNVPTAAQLYVDGDLVANNQGCTSSGSDCQGGTSYIDVDQTLSSGSHDLVFKLWDDLGNVYTAQKTVTVP